MPYKRTKSSASRPVHVFAALGDEQRLRLVARLCTGGPVSITSLVSGAKISRQAVSKHLHVLARAGLVRAHPSGRERIYALDPEPLQQAGEYLAVIAREWDGALGRLKALVEGEIEAGR